MLIRHSGYSTAAFQRASWEIRPAFQWKLLRVGGFSFASLGLNKTGLFAVVNSFGACLHMQLFILFWIALKEIHTCSWPTYSMQLFYFARVYAHLVLISVFSSRLADISFLVKNTIWLVVGTRVEYFYCYNYWPEEWRQKSGYRFAKSLVIHCCLGNPAGLIQKFLIVTSKAKVGLLKASEMSGIVGSS